MQRERYPLVAIRQTLVLTHLLHLLYFSVKGYSQSNGIIEIETSTVSIHLVPPRELKSNVDEDVDKKEKNDENVKKILADIAKSSEIVKPFLDKTGTRCVAKSVQNERLLSETGSTKHRDRSRSTDEDSDKESEDEAPQAKKKK